MWSALEAVGLALVVSFLWFLWPPLVLLGAGVVLVALAYLGESRAARKAAESAEEAP